MATTTVLATVRRSWLEKVLDVVRQLGESADLTVTLNRIVQSVVDVLEFDAVAASLVVGDLVRVEAVAGPPGVRDLLGGTSSLETWERMLEKCALWGGLRFSSHEDHDAAFDEIASWIPPESTMTGPDAWHHDDALFAPMHDSTGRLLGVLSVDQPRSGKLPDVEQQTVLELFAAQAAVAIVEAQARSRVDDARRLAEQRWGLAFERSPVAAALLDRRGDVVSYNDALAAMLGYTPEQISHLSIVDLQHPDDVQLGAAQFRELVAGRLDSYEVEKRFVSGNGEVRWAWLHVGAVRDEDGVVRTIVTQLTDITARRKAEQEQAHLAAHDALTNLPNRSSLEQLIAAYLSAGRPVGVLYGNLDQFKSINDSLGYEAGNQLLVSVARRLRAELPVEYTVGRIGGDEFVVLVPGERDVNQLRALGIRLMRGLERPLAVQGFEHRIGMSVGVTESGAGAGHPEEVLRRAGAALRQAKNQGRSHVEVYDANLDRSTTIEDLRLEQALRGALEGGTGLVSFFQPIVNVQSGLAVGHEALVRWQHPDSGLLEPDEFLPMAERAGLIGPLGWWMLEAGCREAALLGPNGAWVAVNVAPSQLGRGELVPAVSALLDTYSLAADRLHLEITESALVDAIPAVVRELRELADLGVQIALDDFGTGYSSLSLLRDLPVSVVKIDRSFVSPLPVDKKSTAMVRSVVGLCHDLGLTTVAEGVESTRQLDALLDLGCDQAQGYLIGPPAPVHARSLTAPTARHRSPLRR